MTSAQTAQAIAGPINDLGGRFMLSGRTFSTGAQLGFAGTSFYFCGRGGVLDEVGPEVVAAEFGFFEPTNLAAMWESGAGIMARRQAAAHFIGCGYGWAGARLNSGAPTGQFAELVESVLRSVGDDQPRLFAAWLSMDWPGDDTSRAMHAIHLLRELRGGHHVRSVLDVGLDPHAAVFIHGGDGNAELFGWPEPHPETDHGREIWQTAENSTNEAVARVLDSLDDAQQAELIRLTLALLPES